MIELLSIEARFTLRTDLLSDSNAQRTPFNTRFMQSRVKDVAPLAIA
jgi:hypothetical protein